MIVSTLTTNSIASSATIAIVASGNAAIATVVASVSTSTIGVVTIAATTVTPISTNSNIAAAAPAPTTASLVVVACIAAEKALELQHLTFRHGSHGRWLGSGRGHKLYPRSVYPYSSSSTYQPRFAQRGRMG